MLEFVSGRLKSPSVNPGRSFDGLGHGLKKDISVRNEKIYTKLLGFCAVALQ